jgi:hypothetical protein
LQERQLGITQILGSLSKQGVRIRVLTPIDNDVKELISNLRNQQEQEEQQQLSYQKIMLTTIILLIIIMVIPMPILLLWIYKILHQVHQLTPK